MNCKTEITRDVKYIGVNDHEIDLFEGLYDVPNGMAYNSYVILDDKIAVMDTVDARFGKEWLSNLSAVLPKVRTPDYLIVQHMEPDHSANIANFLAAYPNATVVANAKTFALLKNYFGNVAKNTLEVKDCETLCLGRHNLTFVFAPMVHWPEVMVTYDRADKILFSADGFGKFGALDVDEDWACEARRYYFGIVGKYGMPVQNLLKKVAALDIAKICPLHGPVLSDNLGYYINLYNTWSSYGVESQGVVIAYTSVYGHTKAAAELLATELQKLNCKKVVLTDLARSDMAEAVEDAFRYGTLVLATTTYSAEVFPFMREFVHNLVERNYQNRTLAIIENGSWAPMAAKKITEAFSNSKNISWAGTVTILSAMTDDNRLEISALAKELCK